MNTHRIEVLDRADDDDVVREIAHDFQFKLFPAEDRLLDQDLVDGRCGETTTDDLFKLFRVVGDAAARAAKCERWSNDRRVSGLFDEWLRVVPTTDKPATRHRESGFV